MITSAQPWGLGRAQLPLELGGTKQEATLAPSALANVSQPLLPPTPQKTTVTAAEADVIFTRSKQGKGGEGIVSCQGYPNTHL